PPMKLFNILTSVVKSPTGVPPVYQTCLCIPIPAVGHAFRADAPSIRSASTNYICCGSIYSDCPRIHYVRSQPAYSGTETTTRSLHGRAHLPQRSAVL